MEEMKFKGPMVYKPQRAHEKDAGLDMVVAEPMEVMPGVPTMISLGCAVSIPDGYFGLLTHRSSLPMRQDCILSTGVIDSTYRGTVKAVVINFSEEPSYFNKGDRIAQMVIIPCSSVNPEQADELSGTRRGKGGFGSSD